MVAAVYEHKGKTRSRGFQVRWKLYFPDGSFANKYKYLPARQEADSVRRDCDFLEKGSRSGSLSLREVAQARRDGYISEQEARTLTGGKLVADYDLSAVLEAYRKTIAVSHTPVAFEKAFSKAKLICLWLKKNPIPLLTDSDVKRYVLDRREGRLQFRNPKTGFARNGVRPKTVSNEIQIMTGLINEAVKLGMVETNVARSVSVPVKTSKLRKAFSKSDLDRFLVAIDDNRHLLHGQIYEFVMVALYTGFRRSELRTLTWDDIDLVNRRISIQAKSLPGEPDFTPKSGTARSKSIADKLYPIISDIERKGQFLFGGAKPYHIDSISQAVRLVMRRAGLPGWSLHNLRHTYGSWLLRKTGGDLKFVQEELGHLDISTTKNYMHSIESDDQGRDFDYE